MDDDLFSTDPEYQARVRATGEEYERRKHEAIRNAKEVDPRCGDPFLPEFGMGKEYHARCHLIP